MRTHIESIWIDSCDVATARRSKDTSPAAINTESGNALACDAEFVPAAAYLELKAQLVEAWSAGYVAGQECAKDGVPRRNPFSVVEKGEKP